MRRCVDILSSNATAKSFNHENCIDSNTEIIIVGTITPPDGVKNGYFYTAPHNKIYGYIDAARGTNLKELKNSSPIAVEKIKNELKKARIAFLDVMDEVIRPNSYLDENIVEFTLDIKTFEGIFNKYINIKKVICNSRLAESCYNKIINDLRGKGLKLPQPIYCAQRGRGENARKEYWVKNLK